MAFPGKNTFLKAFFLILPAIALGVLAMAVNGISPMLWGQQIGAWVVFALPAMAFCRIRDRLSPVAWCVLLLAILAFSLAGEAVGGAKRWIDVGIFQLNAAILVLPALLVVLEKLNRPHFAILAAAAILSFQPDFSQFIAFSAAAIALLFRRRKNPLWPMACILLLILLAIRCFLVPVTLESVSYCEGIFSMMYGTSWILAAAGAVALAAIPFFLLYGYFRNNQPQLLVLAVYYALSMLFVLTGAYPVPFLGFGLSPIAGYYWAISLAPHS